MRAVATNAREEIRSLFATQARPFRDDAQAPAAWCMGRRFDVHEAAARAAFLRTLRSRLWVTYRHSFPPLRGSTLTNDAGWGCMMRSGQMLLAEALLRKRFGVGWARRSTDGTLSASERHAFVALISMFADDPDAPFSLHRVVGRAGRMGKRPGEWVGPNTIAEIIKALLDAHAERTIASSRAWEHRRGGGGGVPPSAFEDVYVNLAVSVSGSQGHVYVDDVERDILEAIERVGGGVVEDGGTHGEAAAAAAPPAGTSSPPVPPVPPVPPAAAAQAQAQRTWNPVTGFMPSVGEMISAVRGGGGGGDDGECAAAATESVAAGAPLVDDDDDPAAAAAPLVVAPMAWPPSLSLLLLLPLRAGSAATINPTYAAQLLRLLRLPQSLGFVGGVRSKGLYFVGMQPIGSDAGTPSSTSSPSPRVGSNSLSTWLSAVTAAVGAGGDMELTSAVADKRERGANSKRGGRGGAADAKAAAAAQSGILFYLDPHIAQPSVDAAARSGAFTAAQLSSFHCDEVRTLPVNRIDPSFAVGFFCQCQADWEALKGALAQMSGGMGGGRGEGGGAASAPAGASASLFHVSETRPAQYEAAEEVDDEWALI